MPTPRKQKNHSPWLAQLGRVRPLSQRLPKKDYDVLVVGAGIAGVSTAYFLLTTTRHSVVLVDADRVAHAATGHNAGQLVSYFERPFPEIIAEFGEELAIAGQQEVNAAWGLIEQAREDLHLSTPWWIFQGYAGIPDLNTLLHHLEVAEIFSRHHLPQEEIFVAASFTEHHKIPPKYRKFYEVIADGVLAERLQIKSLTYIGALRGQKGCMNSAAFTEEMVTKLQERYADRLHIIEELPVDRVHARTTGIVAETNKGVLQAEYVVLCTNGFEKITLKNEDGQDINTAFHHTVRGAVGYMSAYWQTPGGAPTAVSYLTPEEDGVSAFVAEPYVYMTRRPAESGEEQSLVCIGGPEALYDDTNDYTVDHAFPQAAAQTMAAFMQRQYAKPKGGSLRRVYQWHGLMGYTPNGIRLVGKEPAAPRLFYNLGCNGVGILPSVAGALRIARLLNYEPLPPSIFDPRDMRANLHDHSASRLRALAGWFRGWLPGGERQSRSARAVDRQR